MYRMLSIIVLAANSASAWSQSHDAGPLPESPQSTVGYPTVAPALEALRAKSGVEIHTEPNISGGPSPSGARHETNVTSDSASGWLPSAEQEAEVPHVVHDFLAALDGAAYSKAYDLMAQSEKDLEPFDTMVKRETEFRSRAGQVKERRIIKTSWTKDPAKAPAPGVYVAVDLASRFERIDRHCGYIVLYQADASAPFQVVRQESAFITNEQASDIEKKQSRQAVDELWAGMASYCPNYARAAVGKTD